MSNGDIEKFGGIFPQAQESIMIKMQFKEGKPKLWCKDILFNGEKVTIWVDFRSSNKPSIWTQPSIGDMRASTLGEKKALEAIMTSNLDPKWDANKPITVKNDAGGNEIIEMSVPYKKGKPVDKTPPRESQEPRERKEREQSTPTKFDLISKIKSVVGNDVLEIFGNTGTGKSRIAWHIAKVAEKKGLSVIYYDTERNLSPSAERDMGKIDYRYNPKFGELKNFASKAPKVDVLIIDSIGFPVLTTFAKMNLRQRGDALLGMIAVLGDLKVWTYENKSLAIVINQPISEMGMNEGDIRRPFGDKSAFAAKEVWETDIVKGRDKSTMTVKSFRSRDMGYGTEIMKAVISNRGIDVEWKI